MVHDSTTPEAEAEAEPKRGKVLETFLVRVTLRENTDDVEGDEPDIPTNEQMADWVESAVYGETEYFNRESINATAEKV